MISGFHYIISFIKSKIQIDEVFPRHEVEETYSVKSQASILVRFRAEAKMSDNVKSIRRDFETRKCGSTF